MTALFRVRRERAAGAAGDGRRDAPAATYGRAAHRRRHRPTRGVLPADGVRAARANGAAGVAGGGGGRVEE